MAVEEAHPTTTIKGAEAALQKAWAARSASSRDGGADSLGA
jgi:hypothetical protein